MRWYLCENLAMTGTYIILDQDVLIDLEFLSYANSWIVLIF